MGFYRDFICIDLVGGDWNHGIFLGIIIPADELIFVRGVETTNQHKPSPK